MYKIYAGSTLIYDDTSNEASLRAVAPKLILEDSAAGSLTITLPPSNIGYNLIERMTTDIVVYKDNDILWAGRVLQENKDFWNQRALTCEGELAFFNDSTQPPHEYHYMTVRGFLQALIDIHNAKVAANRRFTLGAVTVTDANDSLYRYTNFEKTMECINDKLVKRLGGHLRVRHENGQRILDYLADAADTNSQTINFGKNLLDFTRSWDSSEYATVIVPLGERLEESPIAALDAYLTVKDVNDGSIYVSSAEAVAAYGWIEKVVHWDDVSTPIRLLNKARAYLSELQFDNMEIELTALDLHYLNPEIEDVKLGDQLRVISVPHGMNRVFPVKKLEIPLEEPQNTLFSLGDTIKTSLTSENNKINSEIIQKIDNLPREQQILDEAQANATAIMNMAVTGYITITRDQYGSETLYFSDERDYTQATKLWKWNMNGLAYSSDGGQTWGTAITMNGAIVADYITAGTMSGERIRAGTLNANKIYVEDTEAGTTTRLDVAVDGLTSRVEGVEEVAVASVVVQYALGTSSSTAPSSGWSTTAPTWEANKYMWQRTVTTYADDVVDEHGQHSHQTISSPTCIQGAAGQRGAPGASGKGVSSIVPEYYLSTSSSSQTGGSWTTTPPAWSSGKYIWTRSHIYYDDNTNVTTTPVLDNTVTDFGQKYTQIKQTVDGLTIEAVGTTSTETVEVEVGDIDDTRYVPTDGSQAFEFVKTNDGYYTSQNAGVDNSYSMSRLTFNFTQQTTVKLKCISYGENAYDFGIISNLDCSLSHTRTEDTTNVFHSFKNESSASVREFTMTIPSGEHFVTLKYIKDSSQSSGGDYFKVKAVCVKTNTSLSKTTLRITSGGVLMSSAEINYNGLVKFSDLSGNGTTMINGSNILTGTISADRIEVDRLHVNTVFHAGYTILSTEDEDGFTPIVKLGITDVAARASEALTEIIGDRIAFLKTGNDDYGYALEIGWGQNIGIFGPVTNSNPPLSWYLGSTAAAWSRLYLRHDSYIWMDNYYDELNITIGRSTYTIWSR